MAASGDNQLRRSRYILFSLVLQRLFKFWVEFQFDSRRRQQLKGVTAPEDVFAHQPWIRLGCSLQERQRVGNILDQLCYLLLSESLPELYLHFNYLIQTTLGLLQEVHIVADLNLLAIFKGRFLDLKNPLVRKITPLSLPAVRSSPCFLYSGDLLAHNDQLYNIKFQQQIMKNNTCKISSLDRHVSKPNKTYSLQKGPREEPASGTTNILKKCAGYKQNEDLDWLEKLVHGFQWYKDRNNNLFNQKNQQAGDAVETSSIAKGQSLQKLQSYSQRKVLSDVTNKRNQKIQQKQGVNQSTVYKNINVVRQQVKAKRVQSESSVVEKKKVYDYLPKKSKPKEYKKHVVNESSKVCQPGINISQFIQICGVSDVKEEPSRPQPKISFSDNKAKVNFNKKLAGTREARKKFIDAVVDAKRSQGKIVKNKSLENKKEAVNRVDISTQENTLIHKQNPADQKFEQIVLISPNTPSRQAKTEGKQAQAQALETKNQFISIIQELKAAQVQKLAPGEAEKRNEGVIKKQQRKLNSSVSSKRALRSGNNHSAANLQNQATCRLNDNSSQNGMVCSVLVTGNQQKNSLMEETKCERQRTKPGAQEVGHNNCKFEQFGSHHIKFVESIKNSHILTEHSYVLERTQPTPDSEWNITDIFQKLDRFRIGTLTAKNCAIENVSREIRYILGPVLEEILHKDIKYDFLEFISRVERVLEAGVVRKARCMTQHAAVNKFGPEPSFRRTNEEPANNNVHDQSRERVFKKYDYSKAFIDCVQTEPQTEAPKQKPIRLATFQDQPDCDTQTFVIPASTSYPTESQIESLSSKYRTQGRTDTFRNRPESFRKDYQSQIVKLEELNRKLENYLTHQGLKEFSTSKYLMEDF